jgi:hypothetical protein
MSTLIHSGAWLPDGHQVFDVIPFSRGFATFTPHYLYIHTANANADSLSRNPISTTPVFDSGESIPEVKETKNKLSQQQEINGVNSTKSYEISTIDTLINLWENTNILEDVKKEQHAEAKLNRIIQQLKANSSPTTNNDKRQPFVQVTRRERRGPSTERDDVENQVPIR